MIAFLGQRYVASKLVIDQVKEKYLQEADYQRLQAMKSYAENTHRCRQQILLEYFDENAEKCGKCDVCKGKTQSDVKLGSATEAVLQYLKSAGAAPITKIVLSLINQFTTEQIKSAIDALLAESVLFADETALIRLTKPNDEKS
jgi:ATP-dependent DNA helicase RecQ